MKIHLVKFFLLFIAGLVLLYFSETTVLTAISYVIIIASVYLMLKTFILRGKGD